MKAMILAAGLGTRLAPLTLLRPKPLTPVANRPVIDIIINYLKTQGVSHVVVNAHTHYEQITKHFTTKKDDHVIVVVEKKILGTGGGIKNAERFLGNDTFIVMNGDVLTDINLETAIRTHKKSNAISTLILHDMKPFNKVAIGSDLHIIDFGREVKEGRFAFTGIHIMEPELLSCIPANEHFNIIDCYRQLIRRGAPVKAHIVEGRYWRDIGNLRSYLDANRDFSGQRHFVIGKECKIHESAKLEEWAVVGDGATIEPGAKVARSVLWDGALVKKGLEINDSIVLPQEASFLLNISPVVKVV